MHCLMSTMFKQSNAIILGPNQYNRSKQSKATTEIRQLEALNIDDISEEGR